MGTKRQRDSNEDDVIKESQKTGSKRQEKMDSYLTKKDSTKINREKSQVHSGEETEEAREKYSKNDLSTPDVKDSDKRGKEKSENERKSKHKYPLDTDSTEIPSKRMKKDESSIVKDKNLKTNYDEYGPKKKHRTNEENRNTSADDFSVNHKELSKKHKKHKKEKKSKHSHKHKHSHKYKSESDKRSKHSHSNKERKSHKDIDEHEHESNQPRPYKEKKSKHSSTDSTESDDSSPYSRRDSEKKSKHSHKDSTESEDTSSTPYSRRDSEQMSKHSHKDSTESEDSSPYPRRYSKKKARDSHNDGIPETNATYPERYPEIHSERSHRSFYGSDSEPSPSKIHSERSHRSFYSSDSEPSPSKDSHSHKDIPKKTSNRSDKITEKGYDFTKRDGKESGGTPQKSRRNYSGAEGSSKDEKYNKEDKVQSRKRNSEHIDTSPSIDKKYSSEKKARTTHGCESTPETPQRHLEKSKSISPKKSEQHVKKEKSKSPKKSEQRVKKEKSKSPKKSERKFEETTESSNTDLIERHTKNIDILIESMKGENRIQDSAERIRYLVDTGTLITTRYDFVYFFGMESPFSQFHSAYFKVQNIMYRCAEQYMMHQKAVLFGDKEIAKQIMEETKPLKMKRLGRKVRNFDAEKWGNKCIEVVTNGNLAKFSQNYLLEKSLFDTHPKIMAEASPRDCLWGIGLGASNEKAWNVRSWRGSNLLGYTLMNVRETLMRQKGEIK